MFRTYEPARDRLVAVKAFRLDLTPERAATLAEELQQVAEAPLDHPSIVRPIAAGVEGTLAYAATEYVAAESLDVAMRHYAPAHIDKVLPFVTQLAGAIDFARAAGIGHGALHPRDVFVTPDDARATGFGVVQALERLGVRAPVRRPYTAPERVGDGPWDVRADEYSLAAIAHELLTGRRPVGAVVEDPGSTAGRHSDAVAAVLSRALAEDPGARYPSALAFAAALEAASRGERTTVVIADAPAVSDQTPTDLDRGLSYELDADTDIDEERAELDADLAEIQLREEEHTRDARVKEDDVEQEPPTRGSSAAAIPIAPPAAPPAPVPEVERSLFDLDVARNKPAIREHELESEVPPVERFDVSEFEERPSADEPFVPEPTPPVSVDDGTFARDLDEESFARDLDERLEHEADLERDREAAYERDEWKDEDSVEPLAPTDTRERRDAFAPSEPQRAASRPRPVLLPVALMLLLGLFVGFLAGYLVGARDGENTAPPDTQSSQASSTEGSRETSRPSPPPATARPSTTAPARPQAQPRAPATRATPPAAAAGRIIVRSAPPGAQVFVNGRRRGTTPLSVRNLPAGTYTVRLTRTGFREATQRVTVSGSSAREVNVRLAREASRPRPAPATSAPAGSFTGALYVDSRPRGARVLLDGREVGTTPLQLDDVRVGAHVVRMELANHRTWTASTQVVAGQTVRVTGSLERQP